MYDFLVMSNFQFTKALVTLLLLGVERGIKKSCTVALISRNFSVIHKAVNFLIEKGAISALFAENLNLSMSFDEKSQNVTRFTQVTITDDNQTAEYEFCVAGFFKDLIQNPNEPKTTFLFTSMNFLIKMS